jgi:HAD superfamily hydrolase (TIGR01509 family)
MKRVVLFDFHNTLATCDSWLELEIKTLPGLVLDELRGNGLLAGQGEHSIDEADNLFRVLRAEVRQSGVEMSALDGTRLVLRKLCYHVAEEALASAVEALEFACLSDVEIMPGAHDCLRELSERGCRLGVVSSAGFPPFVERALEVLGLRTYFSAILTSAEEGIYKSDPELFRRAVARLDALPSEAVHVGDHAIYDVEAARKAGLATIWFAAHARRTALRHGADWDALAAAGSQADAVATDLSEIPALVQSLPD